MRAGIAFLQRDPWRRKHKACLDLRPEVHTSSCRRPDRNVGQVRNDSQSGRGGAQGQGREHP